MLSSLPERELRFKLPAMINLLMFLTVISSINWKQYSDASIQAGTLIIQFWKGNKKYVLKTYYIDMEMLDERYCHKLS